MVLHGLTWWPAGGDELGGATVPLSGACYPEVLLPPRAPATMDHVAYMDNPPDPFNHCWNRYASFRLLALAIKK
jgi:hypothetical protein